MARRALSSSSSGILVFLVVISGFMVTQESAFLTGSNWSNIVNQAVFVAILAVGMTIVLIAGGIDLSVGAVAGLCGGMVANLMAHGVPMPLAFVDALLLGTALGVVNGVVITRLGVPDFIATLAMLGIARGLLFVWTEGVPFLDFLNEEYRTIGGLDKLFWFVSVPLVILGIVAVTAAVLLRSSRIGSHIRATGSNPDGARLSGVDVERVKIGVYALSGALAAVVGILLAGRLTTVQPTMGQGLELSAIAAAVMGGAALTGGRGYILGAVLGALTLAVIQNMINLLDINPAWEVITVGAIIVVVVSIDRLTSLASTGESTTRATART
jgi:ribose transport system permease protein